MTYSFQCDARLINISQAIIKISFVYSAPRTIVKLSKMYNSKMFDEADIMYSPKLKPLV